jgi:hypothetical protein
MKTSSGGKPVKRSAAMNCLLVNQFATPGLGSLMGRRFIEGAVQLALAVGGFVLVIVAFFEWILYLYHQLGGPAPDAGPFPWYGKIGAILFVTSWLLSWITSISLVRQARKEQERELLTKVPPKIEP